ncbi:hypothetical protein A6R68_05748 [Neotoma lepida]|uniref:Uncharacterized protein n=1 Tax=Neotoma lepida TaxID=56216 RepID=A0A1A6GIU8_NEOLE|nr:hypothetical protein A6R68_05748 [Neotoma lepida]
MTQPGHNLQDKMLKGDPEYSNGARGPVEVEWDLECSVEHETSASHIHGGNTLSDFEVFPAEPLITDQAVEALESDWSLGSAPADFPRLRLVGQAEPGRAEPATISGCAPPGPGLRRPVPDTVSDLHLSLPLCVAYDRTPRGNGPERPRRLGRDIPRSLDLQHTH